MARFSMAVKLRPCHGVVSGRSRVRLRQMLASHNHLARKRPALPDFIRAETKYDIQFKVVFDAIRKLMAPPQPQKRKIGFTRDKR